MTMPSTTQIPPGQFQISMTSFFSGAVFVVLLVFSTMTAALLGQVNPTAGMVTGVTGAVLSALLAKRASESLPHNGKAELLASPR